MNSKAYKTYAPAKLDKECYMESIGDIIHRSFDRSDYDVENSEYICQICGERYRFTNTLFLPVAGYFGYQIYDTTEECYAYICNKCVDALQDTINARYNERGGQGNERS